MHPADHPRISYLLQNVSRCLLLQGLFSVLSQSLPVPTCELDRQGRILVPQTLREFAGLEKDVVLTGNLNRIEVWSKEKWNEICDYDDMDSIAESMQDMGITI